jgi:hypothetical protein
VPSPTDIAITTTIKYDFVDAPGFRSLSNNLPNQTPDRSFSNHPIFGRISLSIEEADARV